MINQNITKKNAWILSFIDLLSILLAFFILFYSLSSKENQHHTTDIAKYSSTNLVNTQIHNMIYLKNLLENRLMFDNPNLDYHIHIQKRQIIIELDINQCFKNLEVNEQILKLIRIFEEILQDNSKIIIKYEYKNISEIALDRLLNIKKIFDLIKRIKYIEFSIENIQNNILQNENMKIYINAIHN